MGIFNLIIALLLLQAPAQQVRPASIEGIVTGPSGEPLSKVTVSVAGSPNSLASFNRQLDIIFDVRPPDISTPAAPSQATVTTGKDGKFSLDNLKPGSYFIEAEHTGYDPVQYGQRGPHGNGTTVTLNPGQRLKDVQLTLMPQGAISGRVVDRNGEPLSGAFVQAIQYEYRERGRSLRIVQTVTSNEMGEYRLYWLPQGPYWVNAVPNEDSSGLLSDQPNGVPLNIAMLIRGMTAFGQTTGGLVSSRTLNDGSMVEESPVPVFFPGVYNANEAAPIAVRTGLTTGGVNFTVAPARTQRIRGTTINGITGLPESMQLSLIPRNSTMIAGMFSDQRSADNGAFEITGVTSGSYYLIANGDLSRVIVPVDIGKSDLNNVTLTTALGSLLNGRITIEGNTPGATQLQLVSTDPALPSISSVIEPNKVFHVPGVLPGDYWVSLSGNADRYLKSVRYGGQDGLTNPIHISEQTQNELEIAVGRNTGRLEGRVLNERREPVSNATVVVVPDPPFRQRTSLYYTPRADSSGKFQIDAAPGRYQVFAWEDVDRYAWFDEEFMHRFEGRGRSVTISDNGKESVEVTLISYTP